MPHYGLRRSFNIMQLTWLGRSCFELVTERKMRVVFDPYLELYRQQHQTPFPFPDMICVSHGHLDHFGDVPALVRGDSPALVMAIPELCRALRQLLPETQHRLFPIPWDDEVAVRGICFFAFRSPPMQTSLYEMYQEFGEKKMRDSLLAFRQVADKILYLPLTSFGVVVDKVRLLHFVVEGEGEGEPVDPAEIGRRFAPKVALVGVDVGNEKRSAEYAAALGAATVIPHHHHAYGNLPAAELSSFVQELNRLSPATTILTPEVMETIEL
jgi:L-ascorbate metabolism protein UlaG (beta-lactamase superfamily)